MESMLKQVHRRTVLGSIALTLSLAFAGCSQYPSKGATDVKVHNLRTEPVSIAIRITADGGEQPRVERTLSLDSTDQAVPTRNDKLPIGSDYTVDIDIENGPTESFQWEDVSLDLAPLHVLVDDTSNIVFALQSG